MGYRKKKIDSVTSQYRGGGRLNEKWFSTIIFVCLSGFRYLYTYDNLRVKSRRSCSKIFVFPMRKANQILDLLAFDLLVQKCRKHHFLNDFIEILSRCYNIGRNEQFILYLRLWLIPYRGVSRGNRVSLFFYYLFNICAGGLYFHWNLVEENR